MIQQDPFLVVTLCALVILSIGATACALSCLCAQLEQNREARHRRLLERMRLVMSVRACTRARNERELKHLN